MLAVVSMAQPTFPYNGVLPKDVTSVAFTHATVHVDYQTKLEDATLIMEKGKVKAVGNNIAIPANAVLIDLKGKFIYPSFIDICSDYGLAASAVPAVPIPAATEKGAFGWNQAIKADYNAANAYTHKEDAAKEMRAIGFGTVLSHRMDGIVRGTSAAICLHAEPNTALLKSNVAAHFSFSKGTSQQQYPSSLMGSVALLRQTYYDAKWYAAGGHLQERNLSLEAFAQNQKLPAIFDAGDKWNILRADKVGDEFGVQYIIKTNGTEYQRIADIKAANATLIVPINFPDAYDVSDPYLARLVSLDEMKHWELAPSNCAMLWKEKIPFAITANGLMDKTAFLKNLRKAVLRGLPEAEALKALTYTPAMLMNMQTEVGALKAGMWANLIITSKSIFDDACVLHQNWVQGKPYALEVLDKIDIKGKYNLSAAGAEYVLNVREEGGKIKSEITYMQPGKKKDGTEGVDTLVYPVTLNISGQLVSFSFEAKDNINKGILRMAGNMDAEGKKWAGEGQAANGSWFAWTCARQTEEVKILKPLAVKDSTAAKETYGAVMFPFVAYGWTEKPKQENVLIKNATIWTSDAQGKIENGQILISAGKIKAVGKEVSAGGLTDVRVIDAKGKHVSPGIIDEHSHIALASVNEGAQASSAEVQESTVVWPDDIDIYRQLSGGVTTAQLLHGSANPIGGQSALVKLHWGGNAEDMLIDGADGFIKFALGENVKQSNWNSDGSRFPQSRMGVEQIYYDHFIRAREYGNAMYATASAAALGNLKKTNKSSNKDAAQIKPIALGKPPVRKDLEMEALYEILMKKRFVTCHSYVQSEINMLMHVADSMRFTINTFTHILEGYKVADKMKAHGAGASSFSDWWAYKYEVKDAIPHNGALLWQQGITVAFNSDDAEMARRLNQEAAKAVKYGGVPEEEALKFVTLNPAKLLHLEKRTGSLVVGKDADVVIWSDHPLSIYARAEQTFVDGICYYDVERDIQLRKWIELERARIIQKMLNAKQSGEPVQQPTYKDKKHFHCDTMDQTGAGVSFKN
jgi:imidazolonepropionase-like amidohydrolase